MRGLQLGKTLHGGRLVRQSLSPRGGMMVTSMADRQPCAGSLQLPIGCSFGLRSTLQEALCFYDICGWHL